MNRIAALPRRDWQERAEELIDPLTRALRTRNGTMRLRPFQAAVLAEGCECGGAFCSGRPGIGKTLAAGLMPVVLESKRPLLLVTAEGKMVEKTEREFAELRVHWQIPRTIRIMTYQFLGRPENADALEQYKPDWIGADEAQCLKRVRDAACAKRVAKYLHAHPHCRYTSFSATYTGSGEILDYCHHLVWALRDRAPIPLRPSDQERWARVLNPKREAKPTDYRTVRESLGPFQDWCDAQELFANRLRETPGVIVTTDQFEGPLTVRSTIVPAPEATREAFARLREKWEAPDGWPLEETFSVYRVARQLALGFYYRTDPRPPEEYLKARRAWNDVVRTYVEAGVFDTAGEVVLNLARLPESDREAYAAWLEQRDLFDHQTVIEWIDDSALRFACDWAERHGPAMIWVTETGFGEELARRLGTVYHGEQSRLQHERGDRTVVCSMQANLKGFNMQYAYSKALVMSVPASADRWEQGPLGRIHRDGQERPCYVEAYFSCAEHLTAIDNALDRAETIERTTKQPQKLCHCELTLPAAIPGDRDHPAWMRSRIKPGLED